MLHSYKSLITAGSLSLILASGAAFAENQGSGKATAQAVKPDGVFNSFGLYLNNLAEYIEKLIENNPEIQAKIAEAKAQAGEQKTQPTPVVSTPAYTPAAQGPATRFQTPQSNSPRPIVAQRPTVNKPAVTPTTAFTPSSPWNGNWFQSPRRWWQTQVNNQPTVAKQPTPARPALPSQEDEPKVMANAPSRAAPTPAPKNEPTIAAKPAPAPPARQAPENTVAAAPKPAPAPAPAPAPRQEPTTTVAAAPAPAPAPAPRQEPTPAPEPEPVTGSASLSWSIPTKRENGESLALNEIASYEIYVTAENAGTSRTIRVDNRNQTKYTLSPLDADTYFFSMVTIDSEGMYSELSQVVSKTIN